MTTKEQIKAQHESILRQEERLLRAFAARDILESAGYGTRRRHG